MKELQVLVLSNTFQPLGRVSWQRAITWAFAGRVEILEEYENHVIHTVSEAFQVPAVVRFLKRVKSFFKRSARFNRKNVWLRDHGTCQYCNTKVTQAEFTYDHVIPLAQGGKTTWTNIVVACMKCNQRKANKTPAQAGMRLISQPVQPKSVIYDGAVTQDWTSVPESWKDYLGSERYWNAELTE